MYGLSPEEIEEAAQECDQNNLIKSIHNYDINNPENQQYNNFRHRHRWDFYPEHEELEEIHKPLETVEQVLGFGDDHSFHNIDRAMRNYFNAIEKVKLDE